MARTTDDITVVTFWLGPFTSCPHTVRKIMRSLSQGGQCSWGSSSQMLKETLFLLMHSHKDTDLNCPLSRFLWCHSWCIDLTHSIARKQDCWRLPNPGSTLNLPDTVGLFTFPIVPWDYWRNRGSKKCKGLSKRKQPLSSRTRYKHSPSGSWASFIPTEWWAVRRPLDLAQASSTRILHPLYAFSLVNLTSFIKSQIGSHFSGATLWLS